MGYVLVGNGSWFAGALTAPFITINSLPTGTANVAYSANLTATGTQPITWSVTAGNSTLTSANLTLTSGGLLSGTPNAAVSGNVTFLATNSIGNANTTLTLTVSSAVTGVSPNGPTKTFLAMLAGTSYSQQFSCIGTTPVTWSVTSGASVLTAANLSFSSSGLLTGSSLNATSGNVTITCTNAYGSLSTTIPLNVATTTQTITGTLLQSSNMTYLGAFAITNSGDSAVVGVQNFRYGGGGLSFYKDPSTLKNTLFFAGRGPVAQIEIPGTLVDSTTWSSLTQATILQKFADITNGTLTPDGPTNGLGNSTGSGVQIFGVFPYSGNIIMSASLTYANSQTNSHAKYTGTTIGSGTFSGWYSFVGGGAAANSRSFGGQMSSIPTAWQSALGGAYVTGQQSMSVISTTSAGPSLTVFDPASVGVTNPIPGTTLLFYPINNPVCGPVNCDSEGNGIYNGLSTIRGRALVSSSRSILFVGWDGNGQYWYGNNPSPDGYVDPRGGGYGPHSTSYTYKVWAYNVNDIASVKSGSVNYYDVKPYAIWELPEITSRVNIDQIAGAAHDPNTNRLYIASAYQDYPRIDVYQITP